MIRSMVAARAVAQVAEPRVAVGESGRRSVLEAEAHAAPNCSARANRYP